MDRSRPQRVVWTEAASWISNTPCWCCTCGAVPLEPLSGLNSTFILCGSCPANITTIGHRAHWTNYQCPACRYPDAERQESTYIVSSEDNNVDQSTFAVSTPSSSNHQATQSDPAPEIEMIPIMHDADNDHNSQGDNAADFTVPQLSSSVHATRVENVAVLSAQPVHASSTESEDNDHLITVQSAPDESSQNLEAAHSSSVHIASHKNVAAHSQGSLLGTCIESDDNHQDLELDSAHNQSANDTAPEFAKKDDSIQSPRHDASQSPLNVGAADRVQSDADVSPSPLLGQQLPAPEFPSRSWMSQQHQRIKSCGFVNDNQFEIEDTAWASLYDPMNDYLPPPQEVLNETDCTDAADSNDIWTTEHTAISYDEREDTNHHGTAAEDDDNNNGQQEDWEQGGSPPYVFTEDNYPSKNMYDNVSESIPDDFQFEEQEDRRHATSSFVSNTDELSDLYSGRDLTWKDRAERQRVYKKQRLNPPQTVEDDNATDVPFKPDAAEIQNIERIEQMDICEFDQIGGRSSINVQQHSSVPDQEEDDDIDMDIFNPIGHQEINVASSVNVQSELSNQQQRQITGMLADNDRCVNPRLIPQQTTNTAVAAAANNQQEITNLQPLSFANFPAITVPAMPLTLPSNIPPPLGGPQTNFDPLNWITNLRDPSDLILPPCTPDFSQFTAGSAINDNPHNSPPSTPNVEYLDWGDDLPTCTLEGVESVCSGSKFQIYSVSKTLS